jgi:hypothetical protein
MTLKQVQRGTQALQSPTRFLRFVIYLFIGVGYLYSIVSTEQITLASFLVLTVTYAAWLVIFYTGTQSDEDRENPRRS